MPLTETLSPNVDMTVYDIITFSSDRYKAKERLTVIIDRLHSIGRELTADERLNTVVTLLDAYINATESRPDGYALKRLGDLLLIDDLTDQYKHTRKDDYPFHTKRQTKRRNNRELSSATEY